MFPTIRSAFDPLGVRGGAALTNESSVPDIYADEEESEEPTMGGGAAVREVRFEADAEVDEPTGVRPRFSLESGGCSDPGMRRRNNEDAMLLLENEALYVVADGMGGHAGGAVASRLAVDAMATTFLERSETTCLLSNVPARAAELVEGFAAANEAIRSAAAKNPRLSEMGTTVVAVRFCPNKGRAYIGHVGDSRCYRMRGRTLRQITRDHTLAELGIMGREANRLSRAVGPNGVVEADLVIVEPRAGDVFLLCSDGLTKTLTDDVIQDVLCIEPNPHDAAETLIALANEQGARDNVTVVVVKVSAV